MLMSPVMVAAAAIDGAIADAREVFGCQRLSHAKQKYTMALAKITQVAGRGVYVPGDDIDTDRIIPARFMKCVTFDGLGEYAFYDVRFDEHGRRTATRSTTRASRARSILRLGAQLRLRLVARARPAGALLSAASARSSPRASPRSSSATRRRSACPA